MSFAPGDKVIFLPSGKHHTITVSTKCNGEMFYGLNDREGSMAHESDLKYLAPEPGSAKLDQLCKEMSEMRGEIKQLRQEVQALRSQQNKTN